MSYPLASDVCALVRELLLADAAGAEAVYPNSRILRMMGMAWREMWDAMAQFGMPRPRATFYHLLPAYTNTFVPSKFGVFGISDVVKVEEDAPGASFDITGLTAGDDNSIVITTGAAHGLSSNARGVVTNASQSADGDWFLTVLDSTTLKLNGSEFRTAELTTSAKLVIPSVPSMVGFLPVAPLSIWTRKAPVVALREYQWETDHFKFHGSTAARLLSITAVLSAPPAPTADADLLAVDNCHNFLAYRTAALLAGAQGRDDLFTRYSVMALGPNQKPDGSGGFLAGLTTAAARSTQRTQTQRPTP